MVPVPAHQDTSIIRQTGKGSFMNAELPNASTVESQKSGHHLQGCSHHDLGLFKASVTSYKGTCNQKDKWPAKRFQRKADFSFCDLLDSTDCCWSALSHPWCIKTVLHVSKSAQVDGSVDNPATPVASISDDKSSLTTRHRLTSQPISDIPQQSRHHLRSVCPRASPGQKRGSCHPGVSLELIWLKPPVHIVWYVQYSCGTPHLQSSYWSRHICFLLPPYQRALPEPSPPTNRSPLAAAAIPSGNRSSRSRAIVAAPFRWGSTKSQPSVEVSCGVSEVGKTITETAECMLFSSFLTLCQV